MRLTRSNVLRARRAAWVGACVLAIVARLVVMLRTAGTNDIHTWQSFATSIRDVGLFQTYRAIPDFNHPPLMGLWSLLAGRLSGFDGRWFPFVFKLLPLAGDILAATLLYRESRRLGPVEPALRLACGFLWNPVSVLVTAYHGNTDPLMAALFLWAALLAVRGRAFGAGLALGAALDVKVLALVLVVPLACSSRTRRDLLRFALGFAIMSTPFLPAAMVVGQPLVAHVFQYNSTRAMWGFSLFFTDLLDIRYLGPHLTGASAAFLATARYLIVGSVAGVGLWTRYRGRGTPWLEVSAFALCLSLVLAPGFGFQYLTWPMPLLFAIDSRRAALTSSVGGVFLALLYLHFWDGLPFATSWCGVWPRFGVVWGALTWGLLVEWTVRLARTFVPGPAAVAADAVVRE